MAQVYKDIIRLTIDLKTGVKEAIAPIKQADNLSRVLRCQLINNGKPINLKGSQLLLYVVKADFKQCVINGVINESKTGIVDFELTEQSLILAEEIQCEIVKIDEGEVLLSFPIFKIGIDGALYDNELVESINEFSALTALISNVASWENRFVGECERIEKEFDGKIDEVNTQLSHKATKQELEIEKARIDTFTTLTEGSTTGDAELIDARTGADGVTYHNLGGAIRTQVTKLKENLNELNKLSEKLSSVSIIHKCSVSDERYWNFIVGGKETEEISENYVAVKIPVTSNKLIVYGEFQDWASKYVNNGVYTSIDGTYIQHNTQTYKVSEFNDIPIDTEYLCLSFYKEGLDTSIESINVVSGEFEQNVSYRKTDFVDRLKIYTKEEIDEKNGKNGVVTKLYISTTGNDMTGDGSKSNPYATLLKANDMVTDNSEYHKYEIIVADGTYTDMQEKYKGQNGTYYQGVMAKSYVTYKSESNNPEKCIFIWDGSVGYDVVNDATCTNKCFFHVGSETIDTVIKGFKFVGSNLRYCLHFESNCLSKSVIENCIFDWHGRAYINNGPVVGMGGSLFSHTTFKDCKFLNSQSDAGIQWHDNTYPHDWVNSKNKTEGLCPRGAIIECIDCLFDNLNIQVRSQDEDRPMPCCLILRNCGGLKNVYPTIISDGAKNYWRLLNQCSFITNDLLSNSNDNTTYDEMIEVKNT